MLTTELIDSIRGLLDGRPSGISPELLALEYARRCRDVNERLGKIGLMLESGGEIQALQLAEQPPQLVAAALALSFGGESAWQEYCLNHGHDVAPLIDVRTLEALLAIQGKGLAPNHPLYRDYRAAVSSRDDERAHDLIRVIARMNPGDENASKELKRLQRKSLQTALFSLRSNLEAGDEHLLAAMTRVEEAGMEEEYEQLQEWKQAVAERNRIQKTAAWKRMPVAMDLAEAELAKGEWRQAAMFHGEYAVLAGTFGHCDESIELDRRASAVEAELDRHRAEAQRVEQARILLTEMERIADEVETRAMTPRGLSMDSANSLAEDLAGKLRRFEGLGGGFSINERSRIESALGQLTRVVERSKRAKRFRLVGGLAVAAVILIASAGTGLLAGRASKQADLLASLRNRQSASGVRDLVGKIRDGESLLLKFPGLSAEVAQSSRWLEAMDTNRSLMERELAVLEDARRGGFADVSPPDLFAKLESIGGMVAELPPDLASEASSRLNLLRNEGEMVLTKRREENDRNALTLINRWSGVLEQIDLNGPASKAADALKPANDGLAPFLKLASYEPALLRLPASTEAMIEATDSHIQQVLKRVDAVTGNLDALKHAKTPDAYREAITRLAGCGFSEGAAAQRITDTWPDDEHLKALLVFRGDTDAMKVAANDHVGIVPIPEAAVALDREVISLLATSEVLNNLWEVVWKDGKGGQHSCLSQGALVRTSNDGWRGKLALYPRLTSETLKFKETSIFPYEGNVVVSNQPSATTTMMSRLGLSRLLDETGAKFRSSVLPLLNAVANDPKANPLAKAYVLGQLFRLIRNHKQEEWGLYYCPGLIDDIKAFQELEMKAPLLESAWLLEKTPEYADYWERYFADRGTKSTFKEFLKTHTAAAAVMANPVELAGRVAADGSIVLTPAPGKRLLLAICDSGEGICQLRVCGIADTHGTGIATTTSASPLSPLLAIDLSEDNQAFLWSIHLNSRAHNPTPEQP